VNSPCERDHAESRDRSMMALNRSVTDLNRSGKDHIGDPRSDLLSTTNSPCERDQANPSVRSVEDRQLSVGDRHDGLRGGLPVAMAGVSASASERASVDRRSVTLRDPATLAGDDGVASRTRSHGLAGQSVAGPRRTYGHVEQSVGCPLTLPLCVAAHVNPTGMYGPAGQSIPDPRRTAEPTEWAAHCPRDALLDPTEMSVGSPSGTVPAVRGAPSVRSVDGPRNTLLDTMNMSPSVCDGPRAVREGPAWSVREGPPALDKVALVGPGYKVVQGGHPRCLLSATR